jgi:hypothetical protein
VTRAFKFAVFWFFAQISMQEKSPAQSMARRAQLFCAEGPFPRPFSHRSRQCASGLALQRLTASAALLHFRYTNSFLEFLNFRF